MNYKPILFNTEMVKAILQGRKTQTRRIVPTKYSNTHLEMFTNKYGTRLVEMQNEEEGVTIIHNPDGTTTHRLLAMIEKEPKYKPGDILWVRETWCNLPISQGLRAIQRGTYYYKADNPNFEPVFYGKRPWCPSIHMPKEAARIFLRVVNIRAEQLQRITKEDALAEGADEIESWGGRGDFIKLADYTISNYAKIWDKTVRKADLPRYGWAANPWVWVIRFERVEKPEEWV